VRPVDPSRVTNGDWLSLTLFLVALALAVGEFQVLTGRIEFPWWRLLPTDFFAVNLAAFLVAAGATILLGESFVSGLAG
jgi:hypothetical protein